MNFFMFLWKTNTSFSFNVIKLLLQLCYIFWLFWVLAFIFCRFILEVLKWTKKFSTYLKIRRQIYKMIYSRFLFVLYIYFRYFFNDIDNIKFYFILFSTCTICSTNINVYFVRKHFSIISLVCKRVVNV